MSWKNYDTDEVITDTEMEDVCTACKCFCSEGTLSIECDGIKENCPYYKHIK